MNRIFRSFAPLCLLVSGLHAAVPEEYAVRLGRTFGFLAGQRERLAGIEKSFPDLATEVQEVRQGFEKSAFGEGAPMVEPALKKALGGEWEEVRANMESQIAAGAKEKGAISREEAKKALLLLSTRPQEVVPEKIRQTLLSLNPRYAKSPALEMSEGWVQIVPTKGRPKAIGEDFSVSLPQSWMIAKDGPAVLNFQSDVETSPVKAGILILEISKLFGHEPSKEELAGTLEPESLKKGMPDNATGVEARLLTIGGVQVGAVIGDKIEKTATGEIAVRMTRFMRIHEKHMVVIQFELTLLPDSKETLIQLHARHYPLYQTIVASLSWEKK